MSTPHRSTLAPEVAAAVLNRLRAKLQRGNEFARLAADPNPNEGEYYAQEGLDVVFGIPSPADTGGRHATKVRRPVVVYVTTQNLSDVAGSDEAAILEHLALQDAVADALRDNNPDVAPGASISLRWVPGGGKAVRRVGRDIGVLRSVMEFEVTYAQGFTV